MMALLLLLFGSLVSTLLLRKRVVNRWRLCALSAMICTVTVQIIGFLVTGYFDPFFFIALIVGWVIAFIASLAWHAILPNLNK